MSVTLSNEVSHLVLTNWVMFTNLNVRYETQPETLSSEYIRKGNMHVKLNEVTLHISFFLLKIWHQIFLTLPVLTSHLRCLTVGLDYRDNGGNCRQKLLTIMSVVSTELTMSSRVRWIHFPLHGFVCITFPRLFHNVVCSTFNNILVVSKQNVYMSAPNKLQWVCKYPNTNVKLP